MSARSLVGVCLVHYPIRDRQQKTVATNVTNLDVHDIARAARTFGVDQYYVVHPMHDQRAFVARMLDHWRVGDGSAYNPMRKTALTMVEPIESFAAARNAWDRYVEKQTGTKIPSRVVSTHARSLTGIPAISFADLRERIAQPESPESILLVFGTGFGLTDDFMRSCDLLLAPIRGSSKDDYRHLSVRSAVSIILDRVLGQW